MYVVSVLIGKYHVHFQNPDTRLAGKKKIEPCFAENVLKLSLVTTDPRFLKLSSTALSVEKLTNQEARLDGWLG